MASILGTEFKCLKRIDDKKTIQDIGLFLRVILMLCIYVHNTDKNLWINIRLHT